MDNSIYRCPKCGRAINSRGGSINIGKHLKVNHPRIKGHYVATIELKIGNPKVIIVGNFSSVKKSGGKKRQQDGGTPLNCSQQDTKRRKLKSRKLPKMRSQR